MNVTFDGNCPHNPIYAAILTKGIAAITHRIEVDASSIQWIVYDSNHAPDLTAYGKPKSTLQQLNEKFMLSSPQIRRQYGVSEYGFCYICSKSIQCTIFHEIYNHSWSPLLLHRFIYYIQRLRRIIIQKHLCCLNRIVKHLSIFAVNILSLRLNHHLKSFIPRPPLQGALSARKGIFCNLLNAHRYGRNHIYGVKYRYFPALIHSHTVVFFILLLGKMNSNSVKFILTVHYRCLIIVNKMHNRITFLYNVILIYGIKLSDVSPITSRMTSNQLE